MMRLWLSQVRPRYVIAAGVLVFIFVAIYQQSHLPTRLPAQVTAALSAPFHSEGPFICHDDVRSTINVTAPQEIDRQQVRNIWARVEVLFKDNKPVPDHVDKPARPWDGSDPNIPATREKVRISKSNGAKSRERHAKVVAGLPDFPEGLFTSGRGVVVLAGKQYSEPAATSLGMLRELGSRLPVEVWMINESEELAGWCAELAEEGMACRRLSDYMDVGSVANPYQYKVFTMLFSGFQEMMFMDADNAALKDPAELFETDIYINNGAVTWPDFWESIASPHLPYIVGLTEEWSDHRWYELGTSESGQLLWDKRRHWKSLLLATYYNYYGPDFYYTMLTANFAGWGDKETFALALRAANEPFHAVKHKVKEVFQVPNSYRDGGHGIAMLQADPRNGLAHSALFLHCQIIKFSMRDFFCDGCHDIYSPNEDKPVWRGTYEKPGEPLYENIHLGLRILQKNVFEKDGLDPEPMLFKAMEHTACRSKAWGSEQLCAHVRQYMHRTFGFRFVDGSKSSEKDVDLLGKIGSPDLCVVHPPGWKYATT